MNEYRPFHQELSVDKWQSLPFTVQMSHIGGDVVRAVKWKEKGQSKLALQAVYRTLELFELSLKTPLTPPQLKEVCRTKELFLDFLLGENSYNSSAQAWYNYFSVFDISAAKLRS